MAMGQSTVYIKSCGKPQSVITIFGIIPHINIKLTKHQAPFSSTKPLDKNSSWFIRLTLNKIAEFASRILNASMEMDIEQPNTEY